MCCVLKQLKIHIWIYQGACSSPGVVVLASSPTVLALPAETLWVNVERIQTGLLIPNRV